MTEILIILTVALIVFGPNKLPMLAQHLGKLMKHLQRYQQTLQQFWQQQLLQQKLEENKHKAQAADQLYEDGKE